MKNREEAIINSINGIQQAEVPPYFYTRLRARMQREQEEKKGSFILLRPAFLTASLSIALVINIGFLFQSRRQHVSTPQSNNSANIESFADAYNLNTTSVYQ